MGSHGSSGRPSLERGGAPLSSKWERKSLPVPLGEFAAIAKEEMARAGIWVKCIAGVRICIDVFKQSNIAVKPLSVKTFAWNEIYHQQGISLGRLPLVSECIPGAYALGLGVGVPGLNEWSGHLVAVFGGGTLLDLTLDQVARPAHSIYLPPFFIRDVNRRFLQGDKIIELRVSEGPTYFTYKAFPDDHSYDRAPLWMDRRVTAPVVRAITDRLFTIGNIESHRDE
jgi:hypothetical protein